MQHILIAPSITIGISLNIPHKKVIAFKHEDYMRSHKMKLNKEEWSMKTGGADV
jgi:hypothetical protein